MSTTARQALQDIIAKHGIDVSSDANRCEALLRDWCGSYRREINILVNALEERVPLDLLAAKKTLPRELLLTQLTRRLEEQLALTPEAANWAVESWALALNILTDEELAERENKRTRISEPNRAKTDSKFEAENKIKQTDSENLPPLLNPTKQPPIQRSPQVKPPPVFAPPPNPSLQPRTTMGNINQSPQIQTAPPVKASPQSNQTQSVDPKIAFRPHKRSRKLRGCFIGCFLLLFILSILVVGVPYAIKVMRETQQTSQPPFIR